MKSRPFLGFVMWHPTEEQAEAETPHVSRMIVNDVVLAESHEEVIDKLSRRWEVHDFVGRRKAHEENPWSQIEILVVAVAREAGASSRYPHPQVDMTAGEFEERTRVWGATEKHL